VLAIIAEEVSEIDYARLSEWQLIGRWLRRQWWAYSKNKKEGLQMKVAIIS
jgi:hypothetical protein